MDDALVGRVETECRDRGYDPLDAASGRFLRVLGLATGVRQVLEIGTGGGVSALWLAGALPDDGRLITMEQDAERVLAARDTFTRAGLDAQVSVIAGDVRRFLHKIAGPFDMVLADADPAVQATLVERIVGLVRPGGLLVSARLSWPPPSPGADAADHDDYGTQLARQPGLIHTHVPVGAGLLLSVRQTP